MEWTWLRPVHLQREDPSIWDEGSITMAQMYIGFQHVCITKSSCLCSIISVAVFLCDYNYMMLCLGRPRPIDLCDTLKRVCHRCTIHSLVHAGTEVLQRERGCNPSFTQAGRRHRPPLHIASSERHEPSHCTFSNHQPNAMFKRIFGEVTHAQLHNSIARS